MKQLTLSKSARRWGIGYLIFELLILPALVVDAGAFLGITAPALLNSAYYIINFAACLVIFREVHRVSWENARHNPNSTLKAVVLGYLAAQAGTALLGMLLQAADPGFANVNDLSIRAMLADSPLILGASIVILVPLAEESLFRGLLFLPLLEKSRPAAYLVSVLAFASIHMMGYVGFYPGKALILGFLQYLPPALVLCAAADRSRSLLPSILIHAAVNLTSILILR